MRASFLLVVGLARVALATAACHRSDVAAAKSAPEEPAAAPALAPGAPRLVGRFDRRDPAGPRFAWSASRVEARFRGAGIAVRLRAAPLEPHTVYVDGRELVLHETGTPYSVSVDDGPTTTIDVGGGARRYVLATGLDRARVHTVVLTREAEAFAGVHQLLGFEVEGGALLDPPATRRRRIEIVGDSITCGFGVLGLDQTCPFSADTESEPLAWGALAAKSLGALRMVTAWSGLGVLRNYAGDTTPTMPERYGRALADDETSVWAHAFVPDAIVVALGTNDFAGGQGDPGPEFQASYTTFLATLRSVHPGAHLVAATSPMLSGGSREKLHLYLEGAVAARKAAGDARVSLLEIDEQSEEDGYGCGYHPSRTTQQKMAARLVGHLKVHLGW